MKINQTIILLGAITMIVISLMFHGKTDSYMGVGFGLFWIWVSLE